MTSEIDSLGAETASRNFEADLCDHQMKCSSQVNRYLCSEGQPEAEHNQKYASDVTI
jgi:hypothetical protein